MFAVFLTACVPGYGRSMYLAEKESRHSARGISGPAAFLIRVFAKHTRVCLPFVNSQYCGSSIVETWRCRIGFGATGMPRRGVTQRSEVRTYTSGQKAPRRVRQRRCLCTPEGLSRPFTHDKGASCPLTPANPTRIGCALRGALLPQDPQRQGSRAPTPTASASPLDQDERYRRSTAG
jgi:hypothetical protein